MIELDRIEEQPGTAKAVARTDVVVVGGGPAGFAPPSAAPRGLLGDSRRALSLSGRPRLGRHGARA